MKNIIEHDVIKSIKFLLILGGMIYLIFTLNGTFWFCVILIGLHVGVFAFDLKHRISKGRWRYRPY